MSVGANETNNILERLDKELPQSTFYWLLISICAAIAWFVYLTYYNSRIVGVILTAIVNRFVQNGHIKFGSFSLSVLSGKIMFRDVHYITEDYSVRVQLGWMIFRWWRPFILKPITEDRSRMETRLFLFLESFEFHVYNRTGNIARMEKLFGLETLSSPTTKEPPDENNETKQSPVKGKWQWRDLIPVIKVDISSGRILFGNSTVPNSLSLNVNEARLVYTTKQASTPFDQFMHVLKCNVDSLRVMLVPSLKYTGPIDEPPRYMGEGFVVLQSSDVEMYYYMDEAGLVPYEPEMVQLADGDVIACRTWPCWGTNIKCGKGTDISYGPWVDRQREALWNFFYPPDYQSMVPTELPQPGQPRIFKAFDFKLNILNDSTLDILFTKNKETQAVHMNTGAGTYFEMTIPWTTTDTGYTSHVNGQFLRLDATTSLQFRSLAECETLEYDVVVSYPLNWNDHQAWKCEFTACKATVNLIYQHKCFFVDLIEDWSSKSRPEIYHFIPYTWNITLILKEFEILTLVNEWNWIDCSSQHQENAHIAFCGDMFDMSLKMPFTDYLPKTVPVQLFIRGESVDCRLYLPENNTSRHVLLALAENMKIMTRDGSVSDMPFGMHAEKKWRNSTQKSLGWVDCWTTPIVAVSIQYVYHPSPPLGEMDPAIDPLTPEVEEQLSLPFPIVPLRHQHKRKSYVSQNSQDFDAGEMEGDKVILELEVGPSVLILYGSLLRNFLHLKENYLGEDQKFRDLSEFSTSYQGTKNVDEESDEKKYFDQRKYRPLEVKVMITLHDIQAHLVKNCNKDDPPCPCVYLETLGFELDKNYSETKLQVIISPAVLVAKDYVKRPDQHKHLNEGHLGLSGLQVRGHALFSHEGLPLDSETLEYGWLLEVTVGDLTGKLSIPQLKSILEFAETGVFLIEDSENTLQRATPYILCQHMVPQADCKVETKNKFLCPSGEDIKYRMTRISVDCIDLYLVESGAALNLQVYPIRLSTCNLHGRNNKSGITALLETINIKQYILSIPVTQDYNSQSDLWLEAGGVSLGPVSVDAAMALPSHEFHVIQDKFLKIHDKKTHRLWFLWSPEVSNKPRQVVSTCGCIGGCTFFGKNRNGSRFFQPCEADFVDSTSTAVFCVLKDGENLGFGQSLLQQDQLIFDVGISNLPETPSRMRTRKKSRIISHAGTDTPSTSVTLTEDKSRTSTAPLSREAIVSSRDIIDNVDHADSESTLRFSRDSSILPQLKESDSETMSRKSSKHSLYSGSIPSEYIPDSPMPDAYDTDHYASTPSETVNWVSSRGSVTSLPDADKKLAKSQHQRQRSAELPRVARQVSSTENTNSRSLLSPLQDSPVTHVRRDSKVSVFSHHSADASTSSRQSSLTSPILRRLVSSSSSQTSMNQALSLSSFTGSERFYSATEEMLSDSTLHSASSDMGTLKRSRVESDQGSFSTPSPAAINRSRMTTKSQGSLDISSNTMQDTVVHRKESTTDTESITSFISALSSQVDDVSMDYQTQPNIIDLHGQINQPITKSPLLMSCYMNHMTQLQCTHWSAPPPLPQYVRGSMSSHYQEEEGGSLLSQTITEVVQPPAWIPQFAYVSKGFSPTQMVSKRELKSPPDLNSPSTPSSARVHEKKKQRFFSEEGDDDKTFRKSDRKARLSVSEDTVLSYEDNVSKTMAIINLKGSVNVMVSPLMLESFQRFVEAITPSLASLHPSAIVDRLHFSCTNMVKGRNKLKAEEKSEPETPDDKNIALGLKTEKEEENEGEYKTSRLQVMFSLSRVNISLLQASLVEEVISFSAIDNIRDLTCVSILAISLDNITCQLLSNNHSQKTLESVVGSETSPDSGGWKGVDTKKKSDAGHGECEPDEMPEMQKEEMVGNLHISKIHFQLRRMKKHSNYSDNVILTAIPEYRSKSLFTFEKQEDGDEDETIHSDNQSAPRKQGGPENSPSVQSHSESNPDESEAESIAGFIMFECGLENINLKAAKRLGFHGQMTTEDQEQMQKINDVLSEAQRETDPENSDSSQKKEAETEETESPRNSKGSSDEEAASWQSRVSIASKTADRSMDEEEDMEKKMMDLEGDSSGLVLEFKAVWFNFAAPPPSPPKKKKLDYTRFDWNLLSTATPSINAWMKPSDKLIWATKSFIAGLRRRMNAVTACIMTEALDCHMIHMPYKSKYNKITSLARTLQEDPSCLLLTVLRRFISRVGVQIIEDNVNADTVPQLITIQKGLLALTRQWKNILYTPLLADTNFKSRKKMHPCTVTFAIAQDNSTDNINEQVGLDNFEMVDEKTSLLKHEGSSLMGSFSSLLRPSSEPRMSRNPSSLNVDALNNETAEGKPGEKHPGLGILKVKSRASMESPGKLLLPRNNSLLSPSTSATPNRVPKLSRNDSNISFTSASASSIDHVGGQSVPGTPVRTSLPKPPSEFGQRQDEDLYRWMARQQEYTKTGNLPPLHYYPSIGQDSMFNTQASEVSVDDTQELLHKYMLTQSPLQLADAQTLFKPLFTAIGLQIAPVKTSAIMKNLGGNVSVHGVLASLRVDIIDSESSQSSLKKGKGKSKAKSKRKFHFINTGFEMPAFLCDTFSVQLGMKDIVDFEKEKESDENLNKRKIRFALDSLEAKPTTTKINFGINCYSVSQHVNMSLLRLVHQFVTMVENIDATRIEMKEEQFGHEAYRTHRKTDSKGSSTGTETASVTQVETKETPAPAPAAAPAPVPVPVPAPSPVPEPVKKERPAKQPPPRPPPPNFKHLKNKSNVVKPLTPGHRPDKLPISHIMKSPKRFALRKGKSPGKDVLLQQVFPAGQNVLVEMADTSSPALAEKTIVDEIKENTPKCWRTMYHLLDLYSTMPELKTVGKHAVSRLSVIDEEPDKNSQGDHRNESFNQDDLDFIERQPLRRSYHPQGLASIGKSFTGHAFTQSIFVGERIPLVVFGMAKVKRIHISAVLSGLKLEADLQNVHASATHRERVKGVMNRHSSETSVTAYTGHTMIVLLEGIPPTMQTVVTVNIAKSQGLHSSMTKRSKHLNSGLLTVGKIDVDIPQHPVLLHGMVTRSSRRLSSTLQEFIRPPSKIRKTDSTDGIPSQQPSKHSELNEFMTLGSISQTQQSTDKPSKPFVIHFKAVVQGLTIGASLLPSLKAQYKMGEITSNGVTGKKAKFTVDLLNHTLSFNSKVSDLNSSLPSSAAIDLPPIHVHADYRLQNVDSLNSDGLTEGLMLREGNYFNAVAEVGTFEHSLTTDLLNHLVFVQKVFMKEVNELLQKVSGADQPVPLWTDEGFRVTKYNSKPLLYSFYFKLKGIQITATTPTASAVRLETGFIELEVSNRVQTANKEGSAQNGNQKPKVFAKVQVNLNLSLGQLLKNPLFEEAEPEFQTLASFNTCIGLRNALQDEMIPGQSKDQEALLITLKRPIVFVMPVAFDKAVLVWLNYKNAYEYWNEQRLALNKEVQTATAQVTQSVMDKLPINLSATQHQPAALGTLFLQLTVDDMGLCIPMSAVHQSSGNKILVDNEPGAALVLTLDHTQVSACSCGSLVSKGRFTGFCLRFANDFEVSWDDWKPPVDQEIVMNAMVVPEGTYEVCSRTAGAQANDPYSNAKWILNVQWKMRGIDVHLDTNIGKQLSGLGNTLTTLTGEQDGGMGYDTFDGYASMGGTKPPAVKVETPRKSSIAVDGLPDFVYDTSLDPKVRARLIEKEMNEQAKTVQDLKQLGASHSTVETEERKLLELETIVFRDFRHDMIQRLKRQSVRATALKDKLGLGSKPSHYRSKSMGSAGNLMARRSESHTETLPTWKEEKTNGSSSQKPTHSRALSIDVSDLDIPKVSFSESAVGTSVTGDETDGKNRTVYRKSEHQAMTALKDIQGSSSESTEETDEEEESEDEEVDDEVKKYLTMASRQHFLKYGGLVKQCMGSAGSFSNASITSAGSQKAATVPDPSVDFELDIKVELESGKCVLHPKPPKDEEDNSRRSGKREKASDLSPGPKRKMKKNESSAKIKQMPGSQQQPQDNTTIFFIPGVDVQIHYNSKTSPSSENSPNSTLKGVDPSAMEENSDANLQPVKKMGTKKANIYAWLSLQTLPEEMLIRPVLLDFLEQALEPIPITFASPGSSKTPSKQVPITSMLHLDESTTSMVSTGTYAYASFPVDVVVYIRVQPSVIRFTCLPVSRVECLLRLPSLDLNFSSKKSDTEANMFQESSPQTKVGSTRSSFSGIQRDHHLSGNNTRVRAASGHIEQTFASGGLSVTGCLSDFSLFIFHPCGGHHKKGTSFGLDMSGTDSLPRKKNHYGHMNDSSASSLADSGRKDSLSLNVEFVKVNISRSRKGILQGEPSVSVKVTQGHDPSAKSANIVRFSAVCDIGSASFNYDMRRLSEILALPKAWYRRSLARRMFLGEETMAKVDESVEEETIRDSSSSPPTPDSLSYGGSQTLSSQCLTTVEYENEEGLSENKRAASAERNMHLKPDFKKELEALKKERMGVESSSSSSSTSSEDIFSTKTTNTGTKSSSSVSTVKQKTDRMLSYAAQGTAKGGATWETLVLFAVNLSQLDIMFNMSNVMGIVMWKTKDLKCQGRLSIDSSGYKNMKISTGLIGSSLDAKGGIVGGTIEVQQIDSYLHVSEDPDSEPSHRAGLQLFAIESRLDYMGSSILMGRISSLDVAISDEWRIDHTTAMDTPLATKRPAEIFIHGDLEWDKVHLMISKSTTPDLVRMVNKLEEFFTQQLNSSKRVLSVFGQIPGTSRMRVKRKNSEEVAYLSEVRHHRHWQSVLNHIAGCQLPMLSFPMPGHGTILGGTVTLHGNNLTLATFHGINFRSRSWALFTLDEPHITFATESQDILEDDGSKSTHIVQNMSFNLGHNITEMTQGKHMATICKLSRGYYMPPPFTSVQEWFHYAFATNDIKDLDSFPQMNRQSPESPTERRSTSRKSQDYTHDTEVIFALPSLQLHLKTEHLQGPKEPVVEEPRMPHSDLTDPKPVVECSFVTEFEDHICVAMDAEAILFLHDLVISYLKEKNKGNRASYMTSKGMRSPETEHRNMSDPTDLLQQDFRHFECKTWHLEPTVRLISWAGKKIDPVGVDFILQKLGFQHARLTIPKWMQRGAMDPLDKILSVLLDKLILILRENPHNESNA